jgi:superfamily II DNA or RNA helicase
VKTSSNFSPLAELWRLAKSLFDEPVARERLYRPRSYQIATAIRAFVVTALGANAAIEMPTGTGKTIVACILTTFWLRAFPDDRVLLIVPSRTLVGQHGHVAAWLARRFGVIALTETIGRDRFALAAALTRSRLIVSTPGLAAGALRRRLVDSRVRASFRLAIIDEFDQFLTESMGQEGEVARHHQALETLLLELPADARLLLKSATLPNTAEGKRGGRGRKAEFVATRLSPIPIVPRRSAYAPFEPMADVRGVRVRDRAWFAIFDALSNTIASDYASIDEAVGWPVAQDHVDQIASLVVSGAMTALRRRGLPPTLITPPIRSAFARFERDRREREFLVEDLDAGLAIVHQTRPVKRNDVESFHEGSFAVFSQRDGSAHSFAPGAKVRSVEEFVVVQARGGLVGAILVRTVIALRGLGEGLSSKGVRVAYLHGELSDEERKRAIASLRDRRADVLILTRTTGGRGLDLPFSDYAVVMSPKADPSVYWQELSRIRSTVMREKPAYVFHYDVLYETRKTTDAIDSWSRLGRECRLSWI